MLSCMLVAVWLNRGRSPFTTSAPFLSFWDLVRLLTLRGEVTVAVAGAADSILVDRLINRLSEHASSLAKAL